MFFKSAAGGVRLTMVVLVFLFLLYVSVVIYRNYINTNQQQNQTNI